jgi:hypothetical protein
LGYIWLGGKRRHLTWVESSVTRRVHAHEDLKQSVSDRRNVCIGTEASLVQVTKGGQRDRTWYMQQNMGSGHRQKLSGLIGPFAPDVEFRLFSNYHGKYLEDLKHGNGKLDLLS